MRTTRSRSLETSESAAFGQVSDGDCGFYILERRMIEARFHWSGNILVARERLIVSMRYGSREGKASLGIVQGTMSGHMPFEIFK